MVNFVSSTMKALDEYAKSTDSGIHAKLYDVTDSSHSRQKKMSEYFYSWSRLYFWSRWTIYIDRSSILFILLVEQRRLFGE